MFIYFLNAEGKSPIFININSFYYNCAYTFLTYKNKESSMKKSLIAAAALLSLPFAGEINAQQNSGGDYNLPYGNFGLNYASNELNKAKASLYGDTGIKFFFDYYAVLVSNPYGGQLQGTNYTHEMLYGIIADLEKIANWKGAKFVVSGAYNAGDNLSNKIGNFFTVSESSVTDGAMFYEMYLAQSIDTSWGDTVKIRLGRMSMGDTFASLPVFGYLVSGGIDSTPEAIFYNSPYTSSPVAAWGMTLQYYFNENDISLAAGLYQVMPEMASPSWNGTHFGIDENDGYMLMFQAQWTPTFFQEDNGGYAGQYQIGGYFFGGYAMQDYTSTTGATRNNGYGFYLQGQQVVWVDQSNVNRYINVWAGAQYSPVESISVMTWMTYAGIQFQGFIPYRSQDGIYLSWLTGWFGSGYSNSYSPANNGYVSTYETVLEATYVFQINENISIQPDIQYVMRPYGNPNADDALVLGGQLLVTF